MNAQALRVEEAAAPYRLAPLLTDHLDTYATAPEGFKRLRELVLNLAVRGRLVPQDPKDEPADELLKHIVSDKKRLLAQGEIRRDISVQAVPKGEEPYNLPVGWKWAQLAELVLSVKSGGTPSKNNPEYWDGPIPWASVKDLGFGEAITGTQDSITEVGLEQGSVLVQPGAIIVCTRMGLGKIGETQVALAINQDLKALQLGDGIHKAYFISFFKTLTLRGTGVTVSGIRQDELLAMPVPVPPSSEQTRIVAKVAELMALIDALEAKVGAGETARGRLLDALLAALADSPDAGATADAWAQLAPHFDLLLQTPADVDRLQQTLLQLAVKGRLVPQDPKDEPAAELLKRIRAEKERLVAEGKIKRDKPLSAVSEQEKAFQVPSGWAWARMDEIATQVTDGAHHTPKYVTGGAPFLSVKDLSAGVLNFSNTRFISEADHVELAKRCNPELGDVLLTKIGTTGIAVVIDDPRPFSIFVSVALIKLPSQLIDRGYLTLLINSPFVRKQSEDGTEGVGNKNLVLRKIRAFDLPIPPLPEQSRIVAAVASLTALCDRLRERLAGRRDLSAKLAAALTESALA